MMWQTVWSRTAKEQNRRDYIDNDDDDDDDDDKDDLAQLRRIRDGNLVLPLTYRFDGVQVISPEKLSWTT